MPFHGFIISKLSLQPDHGKGDAITYMEAP